MLMLKIEKKHIIGRMKRTFGWLFLNKNFLKERKVKVPLLKQPRKRKMINMNQMQKMN